MSGFLLEILENLRIFYESLPEQPSNPEASRLARQHAHALFTILVPRSMDLYNPGQQDKRVQLQLAYERVITSIHNRYKTQQIGDLSEAPI
jgi:hypothetical protein